MKIIVVVRIVEVLLLLNATAAIGYSALNLAKIVQSKVEKVGADRNLIEVDASRAEVPNSTGARGFLKRTIPFDSGNYVLVLKNNRRASPVHTSVRHCIDADDEAMANLDNGLTVSENCERGAGARR
jgi:hypothetical protein